MTDLLQMAAAFFEDRHWTHRAIERPRAVEVTHDWAETPFRSYAQAKKDGRLFLYYSVCPEHAPPERRAAVATYLTRVNFGQMVGAFEMDLDDGEVRFRTSIDLEGEPMTGPLLSGVVYPNHQAMIDYLPGLLQVIAGEKDPDLAFRETLEQP
jgi:hypothetical protein